MSVARNKHVTLASDEIKRLLAALREGQSQTQAARRFGCSKNEVSKIVKQAGFRRGRMYS